ncbi:polysaccharide pyruvyl transferase family protein [Aurantimonas sp. A2-1-M11]|uniref:polysaccharide pyruvyl transferase family protein n=1 Tax=Aurantimonas sp. A2-1-M11 TaxID=3113712 RepID=UPI002F91F958
MSVEYDELRRPVRQPRLFGFARLARHFMRRPAQTRKRPARIALFGLFGCGNLGNDGSLEAMLGFLREARPDADLVCICANPDLVAYRFQIATLPISWSRHLQGRARRFDRAFLKIPGKLIDLAQTFWFLHDVELVIVPGTGILDDFGERPYGMPFDILRWCLFARLFGARIAFVSIGAGPIRNRASRWLMTSAARLAHYRSYRDELSKIFMERAGFDTSRDLIYPDLAFNLPAPPTREREANRSGRLTIGVGAMSYYGWYGFDRGGEAIYACYIAKLTQFVTYLLDQDHDVRLLIGEMTDQTAIDDIIREASNARPALAGARIVAEPSHSLRELMSQIDQTDAVVATRFHNIVCALKLGKPTLSLGYSRKNDVLMADMGLGAYCQHVERFEVGRLIDQFQDLMAHRNNCERKISKRTNLYLDELNRQDHHLLTTLI